MANIRDIDFTDKKVLVRVDFNVPLSKTSKINDDSRMVKALPTIKYLLEQGAAVILMSHLGRPQKNRDGNGDIHTKKFTLKNLKKHLKWLLDGVEVHFAADCIGGDTELQAERLPAGEVLLLENTRFHEGETKGEEELALKLSRLADIYINDAFGTAHRSHASTAVIGQYFKPEEKALGFLMLEEITNADKVVKSPKRPVVAIVGGAKVSGKLILLERLIENANMVCIGGGMAYTFIKAQGGKIGKSICQDDYMELALKILEKAKDLGTEIYLPSDVLAADKFSNDAETKIVAIDKIPAEWSGLDIGPKSIKAFHEVILQAKTILWNGPMGVFEFETFSKGTFGIAKAVAEATKKGAFSLIGGGDSVSAIKKSGLADQVSYCSTGGGAMLEYLEGKILPGIAAINDLGK